MRPVLTLPKLLTAFAILASFVGIASRRLHHYRTVAVELTQAESTTYYNFRSAIETAETTAFGDQLISTGYHFYITVNLNKYGDIVSITTDICWAPSDSQLKVIAELPHLHTITLNGAGLTDRSLEYIAGNPSIKRIRTYGRRKFTFAGYARFTARRPDIVMTF